MTDEICLPTSKFSPEECLTEEWLTNLNPNRADALPADWHRRCAFLFAQAMSVSQSLVFGYRGGQKVLTPDDAQKLARLKAALSGAIGQCLRDGICRFILILTTKNAFGITAAETLFALRQEGRHIELATLVDLAYTQRDFGSYGKRDLAEKLERLASAVRQSDILLRFDESQSGLTEIAGAYVRFCARSARAAIVYLGAKQFQRSKIIPLCLENGIAVQNLYGQVNPLAPPPPPLPQQQCWALMQKKAALSRDLRLCAQRILACQAEIDVLDRQLLPAAAHGEDH